jgi:drug/metabolite transporter (DMT)-like permease
MLWVLFVVGAVLSWGMYGVMLHQGQQQLGPLKALLCVGIAYVLVAVFVPVGALASQGALGGFTAKGAAIATFAGVLGAAGAVCIIWAFKNGGLPIYVMPLVFAGAPLVNVIFTAVLHPPKERPSPLLYFGFLLAAIGAGMVLDFRPKS